MSAPTIELGGRSVPRLAFGLGSLMKWAPNHSHPLPTDSSKEVTQALSAGFRHFNTGDLYTNNDSAAQAIKSFGIARSELFFSIKLNTYAMLGCKGRQHMIDSAKREMDRFNLGGRIDLLQLHFPPRGYKGNLTNREAWRVLEDLKDEGVADLIGVANWTLSDYRDLFDSPDLKHPPQVNEVELNPQLLFNPEVREQQVFEHDRGIVQMNYGLLSSLNGRLPQDSADHLARLLDELSAQSDLSNAEVILSWAFHKLNGIVLSSTSKADRAARMVELLGGKGQGLSEKDLAQIEEAAKQDGWEGKRFYSHPHMIKAAAM